MLLMLDFRSQSRILDPRNFYDFLVRPRAHTHTHLDVPTWAPWGPRTHQLSHRGPGPPGPRHGPELPEGHFQHLVYLSDLSPADWLTLSFLWPCLSRSSEKNPPLSFSNMFSIHLLACLLLHFFLSMQVLATQGDANAMPWCHPKWGTNAAQSPMTPWWATASASYQGSPKDCKHNCEPYLIGLVALVLLLRTTARGNGPTS